MRPSSIPDELVNPERVRQTVTVPPELQAHVDPCEALITRGADGLAQVHVRLELEPGELRKIRATGEVWVTFMGGITPFRVSAERPGSD
jgi:hypothetical protein